MDSCIHRRVFQGSAFLRRGVAPQLRMSRDILLREINENKDDFAFPACLQVVGQHQNNDEFDSCQNNSLRGSQFQLSCWQILRGGGSPLLQLKKTVCSKAESSGSDDVPFK